MSSTDGPKTEATIDAKFPFYLNWISKKSSNIRRFAWEEKDETLVIQFIKGGIYAYLQVPKPVYEAMCKAPSVGKFFHESIKGKFSTVRIRVEVVN